MAENLLTRLEHVHPPLILAKILKSLFKILKSALKRMTEANSLKRDKLSNMIGQNWLNTENKYSLWKLLCNVGLSGEQIYFFILFHSFCFLFLVVIIVEYFLVFILGIHYQILITYFWILLNFGFKFFIQHIKTFRKQICFCISLHLVLATK